MAEDTAPLILRIFLGEDDYLDHIPLYEKIVHAATKADMAGATVTKGVMGFGASSVIHKPKMMISADLPMLIEMVDDEDKIMDFMDELDDLFERANAGGLITYQEINVKFYGASKES